MEPGLTTANHHPEPTPPTPRTCWDDIPTGDQLATIIGRASTTAKEGAHTRAQNLGALAMVRPSRPAA